jgi:hypothetical protein
MLIVDNAETGGFVTHAQEESPINSALRQFEATEANLVKLERLWAKITKLTPSGLAFGGDPTYEEHVRGYKDLLHALPSIDGWKPETVPEDLDTIGQMRLDAKEVGELSAEVAVESQIEAPGRELAEYRHRLNTKRRKLIRSVTSDLIAAIDQTLRSFSNAIPKNPNQARKVKSTHWERLKEQVQEIESLLGSTLPRPPRWNDLRRHLSVGMMQDLLDTLTRSSELGAVTNTKHPSWYISVTGTETQKKNSKRENSAAEIFLARVGGPFGPA